MAAAGNSRFAVTCGLLRQYMKEHQQQPPPQLMGGLGAGAFQLPSIAPEARAEETDTKTMELFPTRAAASSRPSQERPEAEGKKAPLTIIYKGQMVVFEDFPADKATELMQVAGSGPSPPATAKISAPVSSDMPIARKASVKRFLEKRKHRITATDPYCQKAPEKGVADGETTAAKDEPAASWLAL